MTSAIPHDSYTAALPPAPNKTLAHTVGYARALTLTQTDGCVRVHHPRAAAATTRSTREGTRSMPAAHQLMFVTLETSQLPKSQVKAAAL